MECACRVFTRVRLEAALRSTLLDANQAYKVSRVNQGDQTAQRVQSAVYLMYLDLLADCDLTRVSYFLDTLDSTESRVSIATIYSTSPSPPRSHSTSSSSKHRPFSA